MKIRVTFDIDYKPSDVAKEIYPQIIDQFLSDWDMNWMVEDGVMSNAMAEVLENA